MSCMGASNHTNEDRAVIGYANIFKQMLNRHSVLDILASKWTIPVIYTLRQGTFRYSAIEKVIPEVTQRALTLTLRNLEHNGCLRRTRKALYLAPY